MRHEAVEPKFGKIRQTLLPIEMAEMGKFIPLALMMMCVVVMYSILRVIKDALVVNAPGADTAAISYLKTLGTLPTAIVAMSIFVKLNSMYSRKTVFYVVTGFFASFFLLFNYLLFPNSELLSPTQFADELQVFLPAGMVGLVAILRNWTYSAFYIMAELWGSIMLAVLVWSTANDVCKSSEAKRFYGYILFISNLANAGVGSILAFLNTLGGWSETVNAVCWMALSGCVLIVGAFWYLQEVTMRKPQFMKIEETGGKKKKAKLGFMQSLQEISRSRYLLLLTILVLGYGLSMALIEIAWKFNTKLLFAGDQQAFAAFQGQAISLASVVTVLGTLIGSSNIMRLFGWKVTALVTPVMILVTGAVFFGTLQFSNLFTGVMVTLGTTPLAVAAWVGLVQNGLSKGFKYAFFDYSKEQAYIPLDADLRINGKAAVDGVASRLGKSGGSAINIALIAMLGSQAAALPFLGLFVIAMVAAWIYAANDLGRQYRLLTATDDVDTAPVAAGAPHTAIKSVASATLNA